MKGLWIPLIFLLAIVGFSILEQTWLHREFSTLEKQLVSLIEDIDEETATGEQVALIEKNWKRTKNTMHAYIPHSEIKDIAYWLAEIHSYVQTKNFEDARARTNTLLSAAKEIPEKFNPSFGNIF